MIKKNKTKQNERRVFGSESCQGDSKVVMVKR